MSINKIVIDGSEIQVWTTAVCDPPVVAVNMSAAIDILDDELTEEEKTNVTDLMAGYCGYVDQKGLTGYGKTEFEAISDLLSKKYLEFVGQAYMKDNHYSISKKLPPMMDRVTVDLYKFK